MYSKCDAIINLVDHIDDPWFCRIINLDAKRKEAWVRLEEDHNLHNKDKVNVQSYDEIKGVQFYQGIINEMSTSGVVIKKLYLVDEKQRRYDVRVKVNIPLVLKALYVGNKYRKLSETLQLEILNVSAGGMLLKSDLNIEDDDVCLIFDFPLDTKYLNCKAQIVRKQPENDYYLYGCKLLNDENDRTELRRFVFKTQIRTRKVVLNYG